MSNTESQVVVAYDFTQCGRAALYRAVALAARAPFHVLHFIYVLEPGADYHHAEQMQQLMADEIAAELKLTAIPDRIHFFVHARIGKPAGEILALSKEIGADLIIVGSRGLTGVKHLALGSVSEHVVREAGCTVEVARPKSYEFVALDKIVTVEGHHTYVPPHRYMYEEHRVSMRPNEWPLY